MPHGNMCQYGTIIFSLTKLPNRHINKPMSKVPLKLAPRIGLSKSFLVRVNQGKRRLSLTKLAELLEVAKEDGIVLNPLDLRPDLAPLLPHLRSCID